MAVPQQEAFYRLVCIDVDGTLLDSHHQPAPGAQEALDCLRQRGVLPVLASGRTRVGVRPLLRSFGLGPAHIGGGGGYACGPDGELLFTRPVDPRVLPVLVERARLVGLGPALHCLDETIIEGSEAHERAMRSYNAGQGPRVPDLLTANVDTPLKLTLWGEPDPLDAFAEWVRAAQLPVEMVRSNQVFLEFNQVGVSKGAAVAVLAAALGVPLERTVAVGDQFNDVSMFAVAGLSVAMGNAPKDVQRAAIHVAPTNDEGGLAWAIKKWIL